MSAEKGASHVSREGAETRRGDPWPRVKLGEVISIKHGYAFEGDGITTEDNGIVLVTPGNFRIGGGFKESNKKFFAKAYPKEYVLSAGDFIVTMTDLSKDSDTLGVSAKVPKTNRVYLHNQRIGLVSMLNPKADRDYVYWFMRTNAYQRQVAGCASGVSVKHTSPAKICNIEIPLPPLPLQRRIADILSAYDDKIANNRRRMELLEESARLHYQKLVADLKSNGAIADVCREERNSVNPTDIDSDTPYIGLEHMPRRSISLCDWDTAQKVTSSKLSFNVGDILFGKIRPYFHKVGMTFVDGVASSDAIVIKPLRELLRPFVLLTVSSDAFVAAASQGMKEGSKMPRADWKQLLKYAIPIPKDDALKKFNSQIQPILDQLKALCMQNRSLAAARDILLPQLMSGRLRIDATACRGKKEVP